MTIAHRLLPAALAFALCCMASASAQESRLPDIGSSAGTVLSPAKQAEYGAMTLAQLRHEGYILDDPLLDGWLRDVGLRLAASSERPQQSFTFFMLRDRQINAELRRFRLRVPEWRVLGILRARQRLSLGEAAASVGLDYTTMSRTVDRLVKAGRILRVTDTADRRITRLALTAEGTRLFDQVWPIVSRLNDVACARLPEGAMPLLCHALSEMVRSLEDSWRERGDPKNATDPAG